MYSFRCHSASAAWLMLGAILLGGGLIATHSHDVHTSGEFSSVVVSGGHEHADTTEHIESSTHIEVERCPACVAARRYGASDSALPATRSDAIVARSVRATDCLAASGSGARPPAPRGPPTV